MSSSKEGARRERLAKTAGHAISHFEATAASVRAALEEAPPTTSNAFAVLNTFTADTAIRNLETVNQNQLRELRGLLAKPAIARIVAEDQDGRRKIYFISEASPHRPPTDGSLAASYRSLPLGRLASLPIGGELEFKAKSGDQTLTVIEKALLRPQLTHGDWDSVNSIVEGERFGPFTITSLRELLRAQGVEIDEADLLDAALAKDRAAAVVMEGLRRNVLDKMELREQAVLDEFQDEIFRLPISSRLVILGPPGTGKTTTLIKRLGLKLDYEHLTEDEHHIVGSTVAGPARHAQSWLMFTPTTLLKQYVKEAFNREGVPASEDRIITWDDYRRDLARDRLGILRSPSSNGQIAMRENLPSLQGPTLTTQREWYLDFDRFQSAMFWDDLRTHAQRLASHSDAQIARLGGHLSDALDSGASGAGAGTFIEIGRLHDDLQALIARQKAETDAKIKTSVGQEHRKNGQFLNELATFASSLTDTDDDDDGDGDEEDETRQIRVGLDAAYEALTRALRARARALLLGRSLPKDTRTGKLIHWLGERGPTTSELREIGQSLLVQTSSRRFLNPMRRYLDAIPTRYRRFRRERQAESKWFKAEGFGSSELNPLEVDVILLAILRAAQGLLSDRRIAREARAGGHAALSRFVELYRTQVVVDEATDFSPIQLSCMAQICDPAARSFVACGDFNQRITDWGSRSEDDLTWVFSDFDIRPVTVTYRHSRQLNELARRIALLSNPQAPEAQLPKRVDNDGVPAVLGVGLSDLAALTQWLATRIGEIERFTKTLPPIAILVSDESLVIPVADMLDRALDAAHISAVACSRGQLAGRDNDVRVFDVAHIKGLEFEAVFFIGVDRLARQQPDLFEKYLYVGATRAAMYLGITTDGPTLPAKIAALQSDFQRQWP